MVSATAVAPGPAPIRPSVQLPAWLEVAKPRLIPLLLATTLGGMALSGGGSLSARTIACTLVGGSLASAAAGVLNCLWEQDLDGRMQRTSRRALPSGRLAQRQAFALAIGLTLLSVVVLVFGVNPLAASLSLLGLCSYVLLYTALLKPRTSQNIVIGGVAGAIPPLVGAAAATGALGWSSWWLFCLVMLWTPAHFWALALLLKDDYRSVGIPMLPVVKGVLVTTRAISHYAWATVAFSLLGVVALPSGGLLYGLMVLPFNARLLQLSSQLRRDSENPQRAKAMFRWSIFYLFGICLLLLIARLPQAALLGPDLLNVRLAMLPTLVG
ncbi:heme o synthase [Synechococcus sp. CS-1331]|uniref:heme o synthase n=1 Tax=Synechococcus sp. CS-1331 TaxID=2847973 RepID=UPI0019B1C444|nr:heme o synthase [Synechococcus sp. CS-1331]MCT0226734.1 heme o synthase [Synechococcus sp. CS-1331]NQW37734.1 protoheme IX farnesyltransferase [Cyanobacteria bacterium bin.275]